MYGCWYSKAKLSTLYIDALKDKVQSIFLGWRPSAQYSQPRCFQSSSCHILNMNEKLSVVINCCLKPLQNSVAYFFSPASLHCLGSPRWFSLEVSHIVEIRWHKGLKSTDAPIGLRLPCCRRPNHKHAERKAMEKQIAKHVSRKPSLGDSAQ